MLKILRIHYVWEYIMVDGWVLKKTHGSWDIADRGKSNIVEELEDRDEWSEMSWNRQGIAIAIMNCQQLQLFGVGLHKTGPLNNQS